MSITPLSSRSLIAFPTLQQTAVVDDQRPATEARSHDRSGFLATFFSTFITIFLAELGDKTQVATLLMSAQSHAPWVVFTGAAAALIATSLLGVLIGRWLSSRLSPRTLEIATGLILLSVTVLLALDLLQ